MFFHSGVLLYKLVGHVLMEDGKACCDIWRLTVQ